MDKTETLYIISDELKQTKHSLEILKQALKMNLYFSHKEKIDSIDTLFLGIENNINKLSEIVATVSVRG